MPIPFACDMTALTADQRARHSHSMKEVFSAVQGIRPTEEGYEFVLARDADMLVRVAEFIGLEQLCCPFFGFGISVPAGDLPVVLQLSGPAGVQPFIRAEFASVLSPTVRFPQV